VPAAVVIEPSALSRFLPSRLVDPSAGAEHTPDLRTRIADHLAVAACRT